MHYNFRGSRKFFDDKENTFRPQIFQYLIILYPSSMDTTKAYTEEPADSWIFVADDQAVISESQEIGLSNQERQSEESDTDSISIIDEGEPEETDELVAKCADLFIDNNTNFENATNSKTALLSCVREDSQTEIQEQPDNDSDVSGSNIKTYVHKKNKSLNTMLNVILLGSVLTATGLAIGHMWGVQDDCALHTNTSVTEVLHSLHKLQVENQRLKHKLTEMEKMKTNIAAVSEQEQKTTPNSVNTKHLVREKNKWDYVDDPTVMSQMKKFIHRDDFEQQINRLNSIYDENKDWLDKEITNRLRREDLLLKQTHSTVTDDGRIVPIGRKTNTVKLKDIQTNNHRKQSSKKEHNQVDVDIESSITTTSFVGPISLDEFTKQNNLQKKQNVNVSKPHSSKTSLGKQNENDINIVKITDTQEEQNQKNPEKRLYSEALKDLKESQQDASTKKAHSEKDVSETINKMADISEFQVVDQETLKNGMKDDLFTAKKKKFFIKKRDDSDNKEKKHKKFKDYDSEDDTIVKDHRYVAQKHKFDKKKNDRQKSYKKQKNENKYQQWEMTRGYLNNDDAGSTVSLDEQLKYSDRNRFSQEWEKQNYMNQYTDDYKKQDSLNSENNNFEKDESKFNRYNTEPKRRNKEYFRRMQPSGGDWYTKLASGRKEMRDREQGASSSSRNKAQWYFERMDNREQCRKQVKNITKNIRDIQNAKRSMNYKTRR